MIARRARAGSAPRRSILRPLPAIASTRRWILVRSGIYFAAIAAATTSLVATLPTEQFYATAAYSESTFDYEINGVLTDPQLTYLRSVALPGSLVTYVTLAPVEITSHGRSASPAFVYLTDQSGRIGQSWFPDTLVVAASGGVGPWFDLSAGAANQLGVAPGDTVDVPFLGTSIEGQVRRILAVTAQGSAFAAVGPISTSARTALASIPDGTAPTAATLRSEVARGTLERGLAATAAKADWTIRSRAEALAAATSDPLLEAPVLVVTTLVGLGLLVAVSIREAAHLVGRRTIDLSILLALGATRSQIIASLLLLEGLASGCGLAIAYFLVRDLAYRLVFAPALPPPFVVPIVAGLVAACGAYLATLAVAARRRLRTMEIVPTLSAAGRAH